MIRYARLVLNLLVTSWVFLAIGCGGVQETPTRIQGTPTPQVQSDPGTMHTGVVTYIDKKSVTIESKVSGKTETFYIDPEKSLPELERVLKKEGIDWKNGMERQ